MHSIHLRRGILAGALAMALFSPTSFAQDAKPADAKDATALDKVVVTGSRIPRSEIEGSAPVVMVTAEQIKAQGFTTLVEFLNSLPQVATPDFSDRISTWGNTAVNARPINLRNLGPDHSLLLIDGHRVADYPQPSAGQSTFQNYNNLPIGMIDHIEVLATGASSIYGSDAVAGVINVVLKKRYEGDHIQITGGGATRGGRNYGDVNFLGGRSGENWHVIYNYEHTNRSPLWGSDRPYTDSEADAGYGAWNPSARMFGFPTSDGLALINADGNYVAPPSGACGQFGSTFSAYDHKTVGTVGRSVDPTSVTSRGVSCTQNAIYKNWVLSPGLRADNAYVAGEYDFSSKLQAYASVGLWTNTGTTNTQLPFLYAMPGLPSGFYDKTSGQVINTYLRQLTPQEMGTFGNTHDREANWDVHVGLKGTVFDDKFNWDLNLGTNRYIVHEHYTGLNEQGMFDYFFGPQLGTTTVGGEALPTYALNTQRFYSPISPSDYRSFAVGGVNSAETWMNQAEFNLNGDLFDTWAGPVGFAGVVEANHQGFKLSPDPRGNTTTFGDPFQNYITGGGTRNRLSTATEFRVPLASTLTWTLSGRLDKYRDDSHADIARTWGTGIEWRPLEGLLLRGTYGTNFHAPDLQAIYLQDSEQTQGNYADPLECIRAGDRACQNFQHPTSFTQFSGGSRNLLNETGHSWTYGFVWDIPHVENLALSVDYWHMGINNAIKWIDLGTALNDEAGCLTGTTPSGAPYIAHTLGSPYCAEAIDNVKRDAQGNITSVTVGPINEASLYVSGIDAKVTYALRTLTMGSFNFEFNYTNNLSFKERDLASDPLLNTRYKYPATRINGTAHWHQGPWDVTLHGERIGQIRANNYDGCEVLPNGIQPSVGDADCSIYKGHVAPWITWSTGASYAINDDVKVGVNVSNIFNRVGRIPYYAGGFEFIPTQQGDDYTGREVFMSLDWKID
ncbi:TonB-dependent receptor [Luteibacter aegosomatis]|uniref:TonB-dependent receptor domain-containing protein n=1 Tax=Luteibacter aegosomatis TaxID=2911537 RepID=UPI001FFAC12E|nr:TonB-dependent receptor [Luteibacter aegosomatis]UPG85231.1 TonB-dependent receptor [Luteibacter aegosomatis]